MQIEPFASLAALQHWAAGRAVPVDEGDYEAVALSLESTSVDLLLQVLTMPQVDTKKKVMLAAAVAQHAYRAMSHDIPPRIIDEVTVRAVASSLKATPELRRELPSYLVQALTAYGG
ncbi:MAG TPA: hypothetical protein VKE95_03475 [Burkholderiales bacterium]|nr:hypothetical protein [Burkholderiales bacterium]